MLGKNITIGLCGAAALLAATGVQAQARRVQRPPSQAPAVNPVDRQPVPTVLRKLRPESAVELPCIGSMVPGTPPYSTTGFQLDARNPLASPIPAGTVLNVDYVIRGDESTGLSPQSMNRSLTLASDLAPGQSIGVASVYAGPSVILTECKVWFDGGLPDLQVVDASYAAGQLRLMVRNNAVFASSRDSTARVRMMKCSQIELGFVDIFVPQVPPQTTLSIFRGITLPSGFQYFDAIADYNRTVLESNENNNTMTGIGVCIN